MTIRVTVPPAISGFEPTLHEFFEAMVHKLNVNSHKHALTDDDVDGLLDKMAAEIAEFKEQRLKDADDPNNLEELADTGNFAFLLYAFLRDRGIRTLREEFITEFFDVDAASGKIYCRKTRSGSPLKVGDEVKGTMRNGRCFIRVQHSITGATISCPRADIVWWYFTGKWPSNMLRNKNGDRSDDRLDNLDHVEPLPDKQFPFTSQYKPKGKEGSDNYGKWVYQRRHRFELIRVGYWDTQEDAAVEGLKAWKAKITEKNNGSV